MKFILPFVVWTTMTNKKPVDQIVSGKAAVLNSPSQDFIITDSKKIEQFSSFLKQLNDSKINIKAPFSHLEKFNLNRKEIDPFIFL